MWILLYVFLALAQFISGIPQREWISQVCMRVLTLEGGDRIQLGTFSVVKFEITCMHYVLM